MAFPDMKNHGIHSDANLILGKRKLVYFAHSLEYNMPFF